MSSRQIEDFIWMSYRYCIGRHTIAAAMHADTIASLIQNNPDILSSDRKSFMVKDIRNEIAGVLNWKKCLQLEGNHDNKDVFSILMYELNKYPEKKKKVFYVDVETDVIYRVDSDTTLYEFETPDSDYTDLIPWVKLANWLDESCHRVITVEFDGKKQEIECYPYPKQDRNADGTVTYKEVWCSIDNPSISTTRYMAEEYITEIKSRE